MYFKTKRTSETGKKFQEIIKKAKLCRKATNKILSRFGVEDYCSDRWAVFGGIEIVIFKNPPDMKVWKKSTEIENGYEPRMTSKEGKKLREEFRNLPIVSRDEFNRIVGCDVGIFYSIGYAFTNKEYFGFMIGSGYSKTVPKDCKEITETEYNKLFYPKKNK